MSPAFGSDVAMDVSCSRKKFDHAAQRNQYEHFTPRRPVAVASVPRLPLPARQEVVAGVLTVAPAATWYAHYVASDRAGRRTSR
jgi:hypothetical protein